MNLIVRLTDNWRVLHSFPGSAMRHGRRAEENGWPGWADVDRTMNSHPFLHRWPCFLGLNGLAKGAETRKVIGVVAPQQLIVWDSVVFVLTAPCH